MNGHPCNEGEGFCYMGNCPTREQQCKAAFGPRKYKLALKKCCQGQKRETEEALPESNPTKPFWKSGTARLDS